MTHVDIYGGENPRHLPLYTVAEAARVVRIHAATLRTWVLGRTYSTQSGKQNWEPLVIIPSRELGRLSFVNLVEVHVLSVLRGKRVRVDRIRSATDFIHQTLNTRHPLADCDTHTDCVSVYVEYLDRLVNASDSRQLELPLRQQLERIDRDENGLASRLFPFTQHGGQITRSIQIDPSRRFGRPVLASTNLETAIVADRFFAGDPTTVVAADFGITETEVQEAIRFESQLRAA
jgi:uncharacterized protein (DUF433 family)